MIASANTSSARLQCSASVPLPDVLVELLRQVDQKEGTVFDTTNLRKEWHKACVAAGLGQHIKVEGKPDPKYTGLILHDLRRSAIKSLMKAGVNEKVAMKISGHKTRDVFDRYHIVDTEDLVQAMRRVQGKVSGESNGETSVKTTRRASRKKMLTA